MLLCVNMHTALDEPVEAPDTQTFKILGRDYTVPAFHSACENDNHNLWGVLLGS